MSLPRRQVVHVRLKIFDDPRVVRTRQVRPGMREPHRPDGRVMRLQNCLEIEGEAVPEGELARVGTSKDAAAFGRPLYKQ
jgi:hypothetical protein